MSNTHPSLAYLAFPGSTWECELPDMLQPLPDGQDERWVDTGGVFSPSVLSLYPSVPQYPNAAGYAVIIGRLQALNDDGKQIAFYSKGKWLPVRIELEPSESFKGYILDRFQCKPRTM